MNTYWLSMAFALALPLLTLANAIFLLRRAIQPGRTHMFSLAASGMVFTFSTFWLAKSAKLLWGIYEGQHGLDVFEHLNTNLTQGPYLAFSMLLLTGTFWLRLALQQRKTRAK